MATMQERIKYIEKLQGRIKDLEAENSRINHIKESLRYKFNHLATKYNRVDAENIKLKKRTTMHDKFISAMTANTNALNQDI